MVTVCEEKLTTYRGPFQVPFAQLFPPFFHFICLVWKVILPILVEAYVFYPVLPCKTDSANHRLFGNVMAGVEINSVAEPELVESQYFAGSGIEIFRPAPAPGI
jgi:hypothetical protein